MKFCPECGTKIEGMKFCPECGFKVERPESTHIQAQQTNELEKRIDDLLVDNEHMTAGIDDEQVLYEFQTNVFGLENVKQNIGGKIDVSVPITRYTVTTERLIFERQSAVSVLGSQGREEISLEHIDDVSVKKGLTDRAVGRGDIVLRIQGKKFVLDNIGDCETAREHIRSAVGKRKRFLEAQAKVDYKKYM